MQQAFDKIRTHLSSATGRCKADGGYSCLYHREDGARCAVGVLITEDEYSKDLEGMKLEKVVDACSSLYGLNVEFLRDLQVVHDESENWGAVGFQGEEQFDDIALRYGLSIE